MKRYLPNLAVAATMTAVSIFFMVFVTHALAETPKEEDFDLSWCFVGTPFVIKVGDTHTVFSWELTGGVWSNSTGGPFDNHAIRCIGRGSVIEGKWNINGFCEMLDRDGDKTLWSHIIDEKGDRFAILTGTGKYAGITGNAEGRKGARFPTIKEGTFQGCDHAVGTYKLP